MPHPLKAPLFAAVCAVTLIACDADTTAPEGQTAEAPRQFVNADTTQIAAALSDDINDNLGQNLGGGVSFRGASAEADSLRMELRLNLAANGVSDRERRRASSSIESSLKRTLCDAPSYRALLAGGGQVDIALYGRDNGFIDSFLYDTPCR